MLTSAVTESVGSMRAFLPESVIQEIWGVSASDIAADDIVINRIGYTIDSTATPGSSSDETLAETGMSANALVTVGSLLLLIGATLIAVLKRSDVVTS